MGNVPEALPTISQRPAAASFGQGSGTSPYSDSSAVLPAAPRVSGAY